MQWQPSKQFQLEYSPILVEKIIEEKHYYEPLKVGCHIFKTIDISSFRASVIYIITPLFLNVDILYFGPLGMD